MVSVEAFLQDVVEYQQTVGHLVFKQAVCQAEIIFVVQHIQVFYDAVVCDMPVCKADHLVEDRQRIAHASVGFLRDDVQCFRLSVDVLFSGHILQVLGNVCNIDAVEVVYLAPAQDRGQNLVLFRCGEDEYRMLRRLFQCFQESVEGRCRKHVHLVDDVHFIPSDLRRYAHLFNQASDVLNRVV